MAATGAVRVHVACLTWDGLDPYTVERNEPLIAALELLAEVPRELDGTIAAARRWDGDARRTWDLVRAG